MSSGTYTAAASINQGDVVCLAGNNFPHPPLVRTATPNILATAPIVGVALTAALGGQPVTVADAGGVPQSITGLPGGAQGPIAVSSTGRCTAALAGAAWLIGDSDRSGDLEVCPRPLEFLDVRWFGAVGDGSTDDFGAIQAAISAFGSAAGTLVFSVGTFMVGSAVTFPPNLQLSFENGGALKRGANLNVTIKGQVQAGPRTSCLLAANLSDTGGYVLSNQHEAWWHWFGAVADSTTADNTGAIQAAINAMSQQHSQAFEGMGGARCLGAPGYYRVAGGLNLKGAGMEFGGVGGLYGPTILVFENGVGTSVQGDSFLYCLTVVQQTAFSRADGLTIRNLSMVQGSGGQVGWQIFTPTALTKCTAIGIRSPFVSLHNVYISGFTGKGIDFSAGGVADDTTFDNVFVQNCGIYGIHVHGGDCNVNSLGGQVTILNCGSWGIVDSSFLGAKWGAIHTAENGCSPDPQGGPLPSMQWQHGATPIHTKVWAPGRAATVGDLVMPTLAWIASPGGVAGKRATNYLGRYQWRVVNAGNGTFASSGGFNNTGEPDWSAAPYDVLLNHPPGNPPNTIVTDGNGVEYQVWCEEGGSFVRGQLFAGGISTITFFYAEDDQNPAIFNAVIVLGADSDHFPEVALGAGAPRMALAGGIMGPLDISTYRDDGAYPIRSFSRPVRARLGGWGQTVNGDAELGWAVGAGPSYVPGQASDGNPSGWHTDYPEGAVEFRWRPGFVRYMLRWGQSSDVWSTFTIAGGRSLPKAGALCLTDYWINGNTQNGQQLDIQQRFTSAFHSLSPNSTTTYPDLAGGTIEKQGTFQPGDFVWNVTRDPTQLPLYPVGWRPTKRTCAGSIDTAWAAQANFVAGTTIQPGGAAGNTVYRAQPNGTYGNMKTGGAMPAFDGVNSFADGGILWVPWGTTNDPSAWEPVIHESVVAISISVAGSSNVTLTEDQGGHQRIIFTGALTGNIKVFVPTGCAAGWGPRLFVNRTSGPFTLMIVANENQGDIGQVLFQGSAQLLWHDGGHIFPAGAAVTQGTTESAILGVKDVTAGGTIALTADEAAHSILKFTGAPVAGVSAIVPAGSAGCWSRTFFNNCSQTVTVKATTVDVGVAVANGVSTRLWSDSMTVRQIT